MLYHLQLKNMNTLAENMTLITPLASDRFSQLLRNAIAQGHEFCEAGQIAVSNLYSTLQQQSLLQSILGYVLTITIIITVICCFIPFHKTIKVKVVKTGNDMV